MRIEAISIFGYLTIISFTSALPDPSPYVNGDGHVHNPKDYKVNQPRTYTLPGENVNLETRSAPVVFRNNKQLLENNDANFKLKPRSSSVVARKGIQNEDANFNLEARSVPLVHRNDKHRLANKEANFKLKPRSSSVVARKGLHNEHTNFNLESRSAPVATTKDFKHDSAAFKPSSSSVDGRYVSGRGMTYIPYNEDEPPTRTDPKSQYQIIRVKPNPPIVIVEQKPSQTHSGGILGGFHSLIHKII